MRPRPGTVELLGKNHGRGLKNFVRPPQLRYFFTELLKLVLLGDGQPVVALATISLGLADPATRCWPDGRRHDRAGGGWCGRRRQGLRRLRGGGRRQLRSGAGRDCPSALASGWPAVCGPTPGAMIKPVAAGRRVITETLAQMNPGLWWKAVRSVLQEALRWTGPGAGVVVRSCVKWQHTGAQRMMVWLAV